MKLTNLLGRFRWDSSDPDRAPPPLPLNPGSSSPASKPNTSATVAAAAEALAARARESNYITNPSPSRVQEKSLIKGQYQKRLQSYQNGSSNVKERGSSVIDGVGSPERSPERVPRTPTFDQDSLLVLRLQPRAQEISAEILQS